MISNAFISIIDRLNMVYYRPKCVVNILLRR